MITFSRLGSMGRLGNQMFQYAMLRSMGRRLGVPFSCPEWRGDRLFLLDDDGERRLFEGASSEAWVQSAVDCGFDSEFADRDNVDYCGYFISPQYFLSDSDVRSWFAFKQDHVQHVNRKYVDVDFANAVGMHLRFGDYLSEVDYYNPRLSYYEKSLTLLAAKRQILVFSDDTVRAKAMLSHLGSRGVFVTGNEDFEDLYLMSRCSAMIVSASTFSWWGAFLCGGTVVRPLDGFLRPGSVLRCTGCWPDSWIPVSAGLRWYDDARFRRRLVGFRRRIRGAVRLLKGR